MKSKTTDELKTELKTAEKLNIFLEENQRELRDFDVTAILEEMIRRKNITRAALAKQAGISEVYLYQILSGKRSPSRTKLICLCIGMNASLEETQSVLSGCGQAVLYPRRKRDAVVMFGIMKGLGLFAINDLLFDSDEETLC